MYPLTIAKPKQVLPVVNVPAVMRTVQQLKGLVKELYVIVGDHENHIKNALGKTNGIKVVYVRQAKPLGTGHALLQLKDKLHDSFLVLNGDDLYAKEDLKKMLQYPAAILAKTVHDPENYGVLTKDGASLKKITEKPKKPTSKLANTGAYLLTPDIFLFKSAMKKTARGELELTDMVQAYAKKNKIRVVTAKFWYPLTFPWSILDAHHDLLKDIDSDIKGTIERFVTIKGDVVIGRGTVVKSGTYIEGPAVIGNNCSIGPNAYIRGSTVVGDDCKIGNAVEIKNTTIMNGTNVGHLSYVGDSVIGEHANLGAGTMIANLRHDEKTIHTPVKGKLIDTGRRKLGAIIADNVHTGINTSIYPGRKLWPGTSTLPSEVVTKDLQSSTKRKKS